MSEEPEIKLYALAVAAIQKSETPSAIGIQIVIAALQEGLSIEEAGLQVARDIFPELLGWADHYATPVEITQGFSLEPYRLTWKLEKSE